MRKLLAVFTIILLIFVGANVFAVNTLFDDDFETGTVGNFPTVPTGDGASWAGPSGTSGSYAVQISNAESKLGSNSFLIQNNDSPNWVGASANFNQSTDDYIFIDYYVRPTAVSWLEGGSITYLDSGGKEAVKLQFGDIANHFGAAPDNHIFYYTGGTETDTGFVYTANTWYHIRIVADQIAPQTYSIFIDDMDTAVITDTAYNDGTAGYINEVLFSSVTSLSNYYYDDVKVFENDAPPAGGGGDTTPPSDATINSGSPLLTNVNPTLDIDFTDDTDLFEVLYKIDSNALPFNDVIATNISGATYNSNWQLDAADWTALSEGNHTIYFLSIDDALNMTTSSTNIVINKDTTDPSMDAGNNVATNVQIFRDATVSDVNGIASYNWTQQAGPGTITFGTPTAEDTTIQADTEGTYTIRLTAIDSATNSAFDEINFVWDTTNPSVDAGVDVDWTKIETWFSPTVSDLNGIASYLWEVIAGVGTPNFTPDATTINPSIKFGNADEDTYTIRLTAIDNAGNSASDTLTFKWDKIKPAAVMPADVPWTRTPTLLDVTSSTTGAPIVTYFWKVNGALPPETLVFDDTGIEDPTVNGLDDEAYVFTVKFEATDQAGNRGPGAAGTMTFSWDAKDPAVDAGVDIYTATVPYANVAIATDPDSGIATYAWTQISGPGIVTFGSPAARDTTLSAVQGIYVVRLTVTDNVGNSSFDELQFAYYSGSPPPTVTGTTPTTDTTPTYNWNDLSGFGVTNYRWSFTNGAPWTETVLFTHTPGAALPEGDNTLYAQSYIVAFGWSISGNFTTAIDLTPPSVDVGADIDWTKANTWLLPTTSDANGIASYSWTITAGTGTPTFSAATAEDTTLKFGNADEDVFTVRLTVTDNVGWTAFDELFFKWDKIKPTVTLPADITWVGSPTLIDALITVSGAPVVTYFWKDNTVTAETLVFDNTGIEDATVNGLSGESKVFDIKLEVTDQAGNKGNDRVNFSWDGIVPTVDAGADIAWTDVQASLNSTNSDLESGLGTYLWEKIAGTGTVIFGNTALDDTTIIGTAGEEGSFTIRLTTTDIAGNANTDTLTFNWDKKAPVVNAGIDVAANAAMLQDATVTDAGGIATYLWTQEAGPGTITFGTSGAEDTTISADTDGIYTIRLTAIDNFGYTDFDEISFNWDTTPPTVNAGTDKLVNIATLQDATASDINGIVSYTWSKQSGPGAITFGSGSAEDTTISSDTDGLHVIRLTVVDNVGNSNFDEINFIWDTTDPSVNAGIDQLVNASNLQGATVFDINGIASYFWTQQSGPGTITFGSATAEDTTIQADTDGVYTIRLTVTDNAGNSIFDEINFTWDTTAPSVNAGIDQLVNIANLQNATVSDLNGIANYSWTKTSGIGTITFGTPIAEDTIISASSDDVYVIRLTAIDNAGNSAFDELNFTWDTIVTLVNAGIDNTTNSIFAQNATASDLNGIASYTWAKISGIGTITFGTPAAEDTTISADTDDTYIIRLTITDSADNSASDTMTLTWSTVLPTVNAGTDKLVNVATLQDATVTDSGGVGIASYSWTQQAGPGVVTFGTPVTEDTTISASTDGIYIIRLTATDNASNSAFDELTFTWDVTNPTVNAGTDKLVKIATLQDAITSDLNGIASYTWTKISGIGTITFGAPATEDTTILASADDVYVIRLTATDNVGNTAFDEITFEWDTTAPSAPTVTSTTPVDDFTPTWNWDTSATTVEFRYSLVDVGPWTTTAVTTYTPVALPYGTYTLYVQARDILSNWSVSGSFTVEIAPLPDHFTFTVQPVDTIANTPITIKIEARDVADALKVAFNGTAILTDSTGSVTPESITFTNGVFDGTVTIPEIQGNITITVTYGAATGISNTFTVYFPKYNIRNNVINPRNGDLVEIYFETTKNQKVTAKVYDLAGDLVKTLIDKSYSAGSYSFTWDGKSKRNKPCVKGLYFIVVRIGKSRKVYKVLVVK